MTTELSATPRAISRNVRRSGLPIPAIVASGGPEAAKSFVDYFTAHIRNRNTREAYARAVVRFLDWCEDQRVRDLRQIQTHHVAAYIESHPGAAPTVKQHLAAIRMLFDWLVIGQVVSANPAHSVRGPKHVVKKGKTPVLTADQARQLLDSIPPDSLAGLRDRALIAVMVFSFARVSAVVHLQAEDYYQEGKRWWFRFREKGGKRHEVPAHHSAEEYVDAYLEAASPTGLEKGSPLFRTVRKNSLTERPMDRNDVLRMVKRRAKSAGLPASISCHSFRATGITAYLDAGGTIENAQAIAAHESPRTTKLYDRTSDAISLDEIEKIQI